MKVRYSLRALGDIEGIADYLGPRNPAAAIKVRASIRSAIRSVAQFPRSGRLQDSGARKVVALPYGYLIFYDVGSAGIEITSIQHPARERETSDG